MWISLYIMWLIFIIYFAASFPFVLMGLHNMGMINLDRKIKKMERDDNE